MEEVNASSHKTSSIERWFQYGKEGAAALAPVIDKGLRRIQKYFNFPNIVYAFALVVTIVAGPCVLVAGLLILSRWGK
ncbi:hypothetical protein RJ639_001721 [Escallonia herrerae]|uniref:Uncharacterized protein n=1 Tax=Escallonia herrerae TaxID=1293975 RepID=A0AA88XCI8_9ASTE|nr:hypothetical protein RJ639_001721 [Escallonia herrerae]